MNEVVLSGLAESDLADIWAFIAPKEKTAAFVKCSLCGGHRAVFSWRVVSRLAA